MAVREYEIDRVRDLRRDKQIVQDVVVEAEVVQEVPLS